MPFDLHALQKGKISRHITVERLKPKEIDVNLATQGK
jgi:hypothetical protein